jgi:hypothetical protein
MEGGMVGVRQQSGAKYRVKLINKHNPNITNNVDRFFCTPSIPYGFVNIQQKIVITITTVGSQKSRCLMGVAG